MLGQRIIPVKVRRSHRCAARARVLVVVLVPGILGGLACPEPAPGSAQPARECPTGFVVTADGMSCDAVLPVDACPPGARPALGSATCVPVGQAACQAGFLIADDGWGCADTLPEAACSGATREVIGQAECQPVGDCAQPLPSTATRFVDAAFTPAELDATHFASVADAVAQATDGEVIAIETGTYTEALQLRRSITLVGRCAAQVVLQGPPAAGPGIEVLAGSVEVSGLTIAGQFNGTIVRPGATASFVDVVFAGNLITGARAIGGTLRLERSVVRDGVADTSGRYGYGVFAERGGRLELRQSAVVGNRQAGVVLQDTGSSGLLEGVVVSDTLAAGDGANGMGVVVSGGPQVELRGCVLARNLESSLYVDSRDASAPSSVQLVDSIVRDTRPRAVGVTLPGGYVEYFGRNLMTQGHATVEVRTSTLQRAGGVSVVAAGGARVVLEDSTVMDTSLFPNGHSTACVAIQAGGVLEATRTAIGRCAGYGVLAYDTSTRLLLTDALITDIARSGEPKDGIGLSLAGPAEATLSNSAITGCQGSAVLAGRGVIDDLAAGTLTLDHVVVGWSGSYADGSFGRGLDLGGEVHAAIAASALVHNHEVALIVRDAGTVVQVKSSAIRDTTSNGDGLAGRAINVQRGGWVIVDDSLLLRNHDIGLLVGQTGSRAQVIASTVHGTLGRGVDDKFGWGLCAIEAGHLELAAVRVLASAGVGLVYAAAGGTVSAGEVRDNLVGVHVQDGSVLREEDSLPAVVGELEVVVTTDTVFANNATRVGSGALPLPELIP